ncbi:MAG TPA: STAS domain-containing protein [Myxococcales bacterium]|jgi:anti-anti-sigma factor|nr:STAS domain-containing protein [Myxococcales bacterium]
MADKSSRGGVSRGEHKAAVLALKPAPGPRAPGMRWEDNVATVAVRGDLDREALWAIDYTIGRAAAEAGRIVLDLRDVSHVDYGGVPEIVARRKELLSRGGDLLIAVRNPYVTNILKAAGGAELVLFRSAEEAAGAAAVVNTRVRMLRKGS